MKNLPVGNRIMDNAYLRDGKNEHVGEALLLACLLHSKGQRRESAEMRQLQRIMKDKNIDTE